MAQSVRVNDKLPQFADYAKLTLDDALREGARDILINARIRAPYGKSGQLRAESEIDQKKKLKWRVSFWKEYARFQEFGGDGKRTVRNYSTPGTGKNYLKKSGDEVAGQIDRIFIKHGRRARP